MSSEINEVRQLVKKARGWLHDGEGQLLFRLAKRCVGQGVIVEIGSYCGRSTVWLGRGSRAGQGIKIFAIDPHTPDSYRVSEGTASDTYKELQENIRAADIGDLTEIIVKTADAAAPDFHQPIELIFIDGNHEYESVISDCRHWYPKVIEGGTMAFHDARDFPAVRRAMREFVYGSRGFRHIRLVRNILYATKASQNTALDQLLNRLTLAWHILSAKVLGTAYGAAIALRVVAPPKEAWRESDEGRGGDGR